MTTTPATQAPQEDLHARCTEALLRHRGCDVPKDRDWASVQFGTIAADDVTAILTTLMENTHD